MAAAMNEPKDIGSIVRETMAAVRREWCCDTTLDQPHAKNCPFEVVDPLPVREEDICHCGGVRNDGTPIPHPRSVPGCRVERVATPDLRGLGVRAAGPRYQDPAAKVGDWPEGSARVVHALMAPPCAECKEPAQPYDQVPGEERWLCATHRKWSWLGTWAHQGWSLRLTPRMTPGQWEAVMPYINQQATSADTQGWDINGVIRVLRRETNKKVEIVLPTVAWWRQYFGGK